MSLSDRKMKLSKKFDEWFCKFLLPKPGTVIEFDTCERCYMCWPLKLIHFYQKRRDEFCPIHRSRSCEMFVERRIILETFVSYHRDHECGAKCSPQGCFCPRRMPNHVSYVGTTGAAKQLVGFDELFDLFLIRHPILGGAVIVVGLSIAFASAVTTTMRNVALSILRSKGPKKFENEDVQSEVEK